MVYMSGVDPVSLCLVNTSIMLDTQYNWIQGNQRGTNLDVMISKEIWQNRLEHENEENSCALWKVSLFTVPISFNPSPIFVTVIWFKRNIQGFSQTVFTTPDWVVVLLSE